MIELLESRIAPAVLLNAKTVQYTDPQGDVVLVHTSAGSWDLAHDLVFGTTAAGGGEILLKIDLADKPKFLGAQISVMATKHGGGDGLATVGFVDATNIPLASVSIDGDLGRIVVGNPVGNPVALGLLQADSMGTTGLASQGGAGNLSSTASGTVGLVKILHDVTGADLALGSVQTVVIGGNLTGTSDGFSGRVSAGSIGSILVKGNLVGSSGGFSGEITAGRIGSVTIGGLVSGGTSQDTGAIVASIHLGTVTIGKTVYGSDGQGSGSIRGGTAGLGSVSIGLALYGGKGLSSGQIQSGGSIGMVQIGTRSSNPADGSVVGSTGPGSGSVFASGTIGSVYIRWNLFGEAGLDSGEIFGYEGIGQVIVRGSIFGGSGFDTGAVQAPMGHIGKVAIGGNLYGGNISGSQNGGESGYINAEVIGSVYIGKSLIAGSNTGTGTLSSSGAIVSDHSIGSIFVGGDIIGSAGVPVLISARGAVQQTTTQDVAIGSIKVGGSVTSANILAGFDTGQMPVDVNAQIGSISVGKNVSATNIVAGVTPGTGDSYWGDNNDQRISDTTDLSYPSRIASIIIGGVVDGSTSSTTDHFGFVADQIGLLKIHGANVQLSAGRLNDTVPVPIAATTGDVFLREV